MENENKEELVFIADIVTVGRIRVKGRGIRKVYVLIVAEVHLQIVPTGFIHVVINVLRIHQVYFSKCIGHSVAVCIIFVEALYPALDIVFRNVKPEAERTCVFKGYLPVLQTKANVRILLGVNVCGMQAIRFKAHGVVAVVNLTVNSVSQRKFVIEVTMGLAGVSENDAVPFINICLAVLKVPHYNGGFAKLQVYFSGNRRIAVKRNRDMAHSALCNRTLHRTDKVEAVHSTERRVRARNSNVISA